MAKFKTIITTAGAAKIAAVLAGTASIVLDNTAKMAVGDGSGTLPVPNPAQTKLVNEVYRAPINRASIDVSNPKNIVVELVIPPEKPETSGFWVREMALYDAAGTLLAVGNMAETYKPSLSEGAGRKMVIRMVIAVSEVNAITITMDTSTVMVTQDYVDSEIDKHAKSRNHPDATLTAKGFTQLNSATNSALETQAATPKAVKTVMDATNLKAPLASPALTGTPTAPTPPQTANNTQLATTAYVKTAVTALINSSPEALDTLGELAAALGNDANFATTVTNELAKKAPIASPALTGKPTAPTAPQASNDTQLATTEFVTRAVAPAFMIRGALPTNANLNNYGPKPDLIGQWSFGVAGALIANGFPEDSTQGIFEVFNGGPYLGSQRFTTKSGNIYYRNLSGSWNGVDGPWSAWLPVGYSPMPGYFTGDMNTLLSPGNWSITSAVTNGPIPAGQTATPTGICKVELRSSTNSVVQTFTSVATNAAFMNRTWTRTLSGTTWSNWDPQGKGALADLGLGLSKTPLTTAFDWQQADFITGNNQLVSVSDWLNAPAALKYSSSEILNILCIAAGTGSTRFTLRITSQSVAGYEYYVVVNGVKGSRTFGISQNFNSDPTTIIPIINGGTGGKTVAEARNNLGFDAMGIGVPVPMVSAMDWQTFDFIPGAQHVCLPSNQTNIPAGLTYVSTTAPTNINVLGGRGNTTALILLVTQFTTAATAKSYFIVVSGSPPARTFTIYENLTSASIVPFANGGTGGKTVEEARGNLGVNRLVQGKDDTYITSQSDNYRLFVNDQGGWGVLNNIGTPQPLALNQGGTGATDAPAARTKLGLGNSATRDIGTVANTVAAGNDSRIVNAVQKAEFTSGPGWAKFPDGTIIQTGIAPAGYLGFPSDVTYPIPFTVGGPTIIANFDSAVANANDCPAFATTPLTNASFRLMSSRVNTGTTPYARWIAIGK